MKTYKYPKVGNYLILLKDFHLLGVTGDILLKRGSVGEILQVQFTSISIDEVKPTIIFGYEGNMYLINGTVHPDSFLIVEEERELEAAKVLFGEKQK